MINLNGLDLWQRKEISWLPRRAQASKLLFPRVTRKSFEMQARVRELRPGLLKKGYDLHLGVGMAAGYATIGTIGFEGRMDYAAVGKVTILASRLSSEANGGQILTDQKTLSKVEHLVEAEHLKELQLKGFNRPTTVFNILGLRC